MKKTYLLLLSALALLTALVPFGVMAGFGVSPPYFGNTTLTRNSVYEQKIVLVRSDPTEDLKAEVKIDVPGANEWIQVDRGNDFILPKGEKQIPLMVKVSIPKDAAFAEYKGNIRVRLLPPGGPASGTVSIALGIQIDVNLAVIDKQIFDFKIGAIKTLDLEEGKKVWWLYFPGKITFIMKLENTGNVPAAPSRVVFEIFDHKGNLLETTENLNDINEIDAFDSGEAIAELPTRLKAGSYTAKYKIYKGSEIAQEGDINVSILPPGTLNNYLGFGFAGLSSKEKAGIGAAAGLVLILFIVLFVKIIKKFRKRSPARQ